MRTLTDVLKYRNHVNNHAAKAIDSANIQPAASSVSFESDEDLTNSPTAPKTMKIRHAARTDSCAATTLNVNFAFLAMQIPATRFNDLNTNEIRNMNSEPMAEMRIPAGVGRGSTTTPTKHPMQ
jgi:hypothetical protein